MPQHKAPEMFQDGEADEFVAGPDETTAVWLERELAGCEFADERLGARFRKIVQQLSKNIGARIPLACRDWANTKAAYRFLSNRRVRDYEILAGHFQATRERFAATDDVVLILHDTTEFTYSRNDVASVRILHKNLIGPKSRGRHYTVCGILMHSSLAVTTEGLPLGLAAIKFWTRSKFKGTNALKRKINPTRVPIEEKESIRWLQNLNQSTTLLGDPQRCVHVGDRESDIYGSSVRPSKAVLAFWFALVWTDWRAMERPQFPLQWTKFLFSTCIGWRSATRKAKCLGLLSKLNIIASACIRQ
jgi:hypothetical protein